jgi:hypothetical protein
MKKDYTKYNFVEARKEKMHYKKQMLLRINKCVDDIIYINNNCVLQSSPTMWVYFTNSEYDGEYEITNDILIQLIEVYKYNGNILYMPNSNGRIYPQIGNIYRYPSIKTTYKLYKNSMYGILGNKEKYYLNIKYIKTIEGKQDDFTNNMITNYYDMIMNYYDIAMYNDFSILCTTNYKDIESAVRLYKIDSLIC